MISFYKYMGCLKTVPLDISHLSLFNKIPIQMDRYFVDSQPGEFVTVLQSSSTGSVNNSQEGEEETIQIYSFKPATKCCAGNWT